MGVTPELHETAKNISKALNTTVNCLPGQKDIGNAITSIIEWSSSINLTSFPHSNKSYGELQVQLNNAAANLNDASKNVVQSVHKPDKLASSSKDFASAYKELMDVSMEMAGQTPDVTIRSEMVHSLRSVSTTSSALLTTAKSLYADPNLPNGKNQLAAAARAVTDSINYLVNVCTSAAPGMNG